MVEYQYDTTFITIGDSILAGEAYDARLARADAASNSSSPSSPMVAGPSRRSAIRAPLTITVGDLSPIQIQRPFQPSQPVSASLDAQPGTPPLEILEAHAMELDESSLSSGQHSSDNAFNTTPDLTDAESLPSPIINRRHNVCALASSQSSNSTEEEVVNSYEGYVNPQQHNQR